MKNIILILILSSLTNVVNAQNPLKKQWDKRYGGLFYEELTSIETTNDSGFIIGGWSNSRNSGDKTQDNWDPLNLTKDFWIVKIDSSGNKKWDYRFGGTKDDLLECIKKTTDHGFILGGVSKSGVSGDKSQANWGPAFSLNDYWILKIDSLGFKIWDKRFGGTSDDYLTSIQQTTDGGYILAGASFSDANGDKTENRKGGHDYWIVKIDSIGNKQWDKTFGGDRDESLYIEILQTKDGGYIIGGESRSSVSGDKTQPNRDSTNTTFDYWVIKTNANGIKEWDKCFGGDNNDHFHSIIQTVDSGYILAGISYSGISGDKTEDLVGGWDYWIVKIDSIGNKQWDKDYGGSLDESRNFFDNNFGNIIQLKDGNYLLSGNSESSSTGDKTEMNLGYTEGWLIKVDIEGKIIWDKTILTTGDNVVGGAVEYANGCYTIATFSSSEIGGYKTQANWTPTISFHDYWTINFCECQYNEFPKASFTNSYSNGCANHCVTFSDNSDCYTNRLWHFPGGIPSSSTEQIPTVCYPHGGQFPVTLIVSNANGSDTLVKNNYINIHPIRPSINVSGSTLTSTPAAYYQCYYQIH